MGTTSLRRYPYPEPTDPVGGGAAAIRQLAETVEADHRLASTTVVGDWATAGTGFALVSGEVVTYAGITHLRLTVRRTGDSVWVDALSGTIPETAGHLIATIKAGDWEHARPCPLTDPAFTVGPRRHGSSETPRGGRGAITAAGALYLHGVDATDSMALSRGDQVAVTATYPNRTAFAR